MKNVYLVILILVFPYLLSAQVFWAAGYTESLDSIHNGQILIHPLADTVLIEPFDSPVQFESTMAGAFDHEGEIIFYTNGCHIYDGEHEIVPGGENLNPGEIHDMVCDEYGYIAPLGASIVHFRTHPHLYFLIHVGVQNTIAHSVSYGPLYLTRLEYDTESGTINVLSKNEILIETEVDPYELVRHANGNDWWLLSNQFGTSTYHKILLSPEGPSIHEMQDVGYEFPFPPCRWQRSLTASPSGERLVRYNSKCGAQFLTFDRCSGMLSEAGFSSLEFNVMGGGGTAFSEDSEYVYFSRWYQIMKVPFASPPDTLRTSFRPPAGVGGSFVHIFRDPHGRMYIAPQASEPYLHLIPPGDSDPDTAMVSLEGLQLPRRIQRTIPHYPNYELGALEESPCDTLLSNVLDQIPPIEHVYLYPNPAKDMITLEMDLSGQKEVVILNALGEVLTQSTTSAQRLGIQLGHYAHGLYFVQVFKAGRPIGTGKFIKN
jgi:hypothetical protein